MRRLDILGVRVDDIDREHLEHAILECCKEGRKEVFAYVNVHAINIAQGNMRFREFLNDASVVYCDGEGVRFGTKILGLRPPTRTVLTRWIWSLSALFQQKGLSVFLLGARSETVLRAASELSSRYPNLRLGGHHHGYFDKSGAENTGVVDLINQARPSVLFVGFGMPEQEQWIEENLDRLQVHAVIPCGAMFDYLSGEKKSAPGWLAENGIEWAHRLVQNPARLWKRYLWGNPMFLFRVFRQRMSEGRKS